MQWKVSPLNEIELESGPLVNARATFSEREGPADQRIILEDDSLINELNFCFQQK